MHLLWRGVGLCRERCKSFFVVSTACIYTSDFVRRKCLFVWRYCQSGFWKLSFKYFVTNASSRTSASPPPGRVPGLSPLGRSCSCCSACAEKQTVFQISKKVGTSKMIFIWTIDDSTWLPRRGSFVSLQFWTKGFIICSFFQFCFYFLHFLHFCT